MVSTAPAIKKGRRDHFLPQSYLRGFIDPARESVPEPLWRLDIRHQTWRMRAPKAVAWKEGFYDLAGDDPALEEVESADEVFADLENEFDGMRSWLLKREFRNWHKHLGFLLRYMHMICVRSPLYFEQKKEQGKTLRAAVIRHIDPGGANLTAGEFAPLSEPQIKNWTLSNMRQDIRKNGDWLRIFTWAIRYCDSVDNPFVVSDQPLVIEGSGDVEDAAKDPASLLMFPLCWQACLFGSLVRFDKGTDKLGLQDMITMRKKYRSFASDFLLSPTKLEDITAPIVAG